MEALIAELKAEARKRKTTPKMGNRPYPARLRAAAAEYGRRQRDAGMSQAGIAKELGVSETTVCKWLRPEVSTFKAVRVIAERRAGAETGRLCVVTPHGYRVEGLDVASTAALLRELG
jgi:predicted transcriptional regulator